MCVARTACRRRSQMRLDRKYKRRDPAAAARRKASAAAAAAREGRSYGVSKK
jgi:hypothetical protein